MGIWVIRLILLIHVRFLFRLGQHQVFAPDEAGHALVEGALLDLPHREQGQDPGGQHIDEGGGADAPKTMNMSQTSG